MVHCVEMLINYMFHYFIIYYYAACYLETVEEIGRTSGHVARDTSRLYLSVHVVH